MSKNNRYRIIVEIKTLRRMKKITIAKAYNPMCLGLKQILKNLTYY